MAAVVVMILLLSITVWFWVDCIDKTDTKPYEKCKKCSNIWCLKNPDYCEGDDNDKEDS